MYIQRKGKEWGVHGNNYGDGIYDTCRRFDEPTGEPTEWLNTDGTPDTTCVNRETENNLFSEDGTKCEQP